MYNNKTQLQPQPSSHKWFLIKDLLHLGWDDTLLSNQKFEWTPIQDLATASRATEKLYNEKDLVKKYIHNLNNKIAYYYNLAMERTQRQMEI